MNSSAYLAVQINHLRHEELLREAAEYRLRSGEREPRRPRGRHRRR
ncbi:hypothetical protein AB0M20_35165 [Actinoplanes sp. NPDC051633]